MTDAAPDLPSPDDVPPMLRSALGQIDFARNYTVALLDATPKDRWHEVPANSPTSIAWQIGHLTVSQYGLLMFRVRGRQPDDLDLIPGKFRKAFGRGSDPAAIGEQTASPDELLERFGRVHRQAMTELHALLDTPDVAEQLLEPVDMPYAAYPVKLGAILFCPLHEQIHSGQIGLTRRLLGLDPVR
ncbi:DinB family protein [Crateriforma spongiae]|uniref:DinB family protein n=1 Tax=Crateriforma spongiae TaxID=2724528 RepID=UPI001F337AC1|nr:DinB family protein [Crateriforma spongiae]